MQSITPLALREKLSLHEDIQLVDVREPDEHDDFNLGGILIPLGDIISGIGLIEKDRPVIIYCRKGIRSQIAIQRLCEKYPFHNLYNLVGGTEAWRKCFEP